MTATDNGPIPKPAKRKKAKKAKAVKMKHCDAVWRQCIRLMFKGRCAVCDKEDGQLDCHHLISRAAHFYRHNLNNGVLLCARCHKFNPKLSAHAAPWSFDDFMAARLPEIWTWWAKNRNEIHPAPKIDYAAVLQNLKDELAKLEAAKPQGD